MPSPFPGMDPYLEAPPFWGVLHGTMITAMLAELNRSLPPGYTAWSDIYIWLHEPDAETRLGAPDVFMTGQPTGAGGAAVLKAPAFSILPAVRREGTKFLKIKEMDTERVITVIELLSPANKTGEDREAYLAKRNEYLATGTNLVEIDLLRNGKRMPMGQPSPPSADYYVLVSRAVDFPQTAIWPFTVRDPFPDIPVPLKPQDEFVTLALQRCFEVAYDQGPYTRAVDYAQPPKIPLKETDDRWAEEMVAARLRET